jgi:hypothetical protein
MIYRCVARMPAGLHSRTLAKAAHILGGIDALAKSSPMRGFRIHSGLFPPTTHARFASTSSTQAAGKSRSERLSPVSA